MNKPKYPGGLTAAAEALGVSCERYLCIDPILGEQWACLPVFNGRYSVSSVGRVRAEAHQRQTSINGSPIYNVPARILRPAIDRDGYFKVTIGQRTKQKRQSIHRLVLIAFIGAAPAGLQCLHGNGDKKDNRVCNLRWGTASENQYDALRHGTSKIAEISKKWAPTRRGAGNGRAKLTDAAVQFIRSSGSPTRILAERFGVNRTTIQSVRRGSTWPIQTARLAEAEGRHHG